MSLVALVNFDSLRWLLIAGSLFLVIVVIAFVCRPAVPRLTHFLIAAGLLLLCLAAGGMSLERPMTGQATIMVDLSASTRTARYRDTSMLRGRIDQLLGQTPYRILFFAQSQSPQAELGSATLEDLPGDETVFAPPPAGPIVLFSDAQFPLPRALPAAATYVVIDPALESAPDAAVKSIEFRGNEAVVGIANAGASRNVTISGTSTKTPSTAPTGNILITRPLANATSRVSATIEKGDAWPENDSLAAIVPPSPKGERWWIGNSEPGSGWRQINARSFPTDRAALLSPSVIVLNNVAATDLSLEQQDRLRQYVRNFGGGLVILGGDHAFAAGGYAGSVLETLSPLASTPPEPTSQWLLLTDSSGSMASDAGSGATRWKVAVDAIAKIIPALPPADRVSIGGFARELTWWVRDATAKDLSVDRFPPQGASPRGPTMLADALANVAKSAGDSNLPSQLLLMTDAGATIEKPAEIAAALNSKKVRLHVLIIGEEEGAGLAALRQIASLTQGRILTELDPQKWTAAVRELMQAAAPDLLRRDPIRVNFSDALKSLPTARAELWNRTWLKESAAPLGQASLGNEQLTPVARAVGDERIIAAAFSPTDAQVEAFVKVVERPPRDPRFTTTWEIGSKVRVTVDAVDANGEYMNGEFLSAMLLNDRGEADLIQVPLPQVGPGRYQWTADAPREPGVVEINFGGGVAEYRSIPGRYPPEFEAIGNDHRTMNELASRSGGRVIEPGDAKPIDFKWPTKRTPLASWLATLGAVLIAAGLVRWRVA